MSEIGIITNPHAKLNKRNPERQKLLGYIAGKQGHLKITNDIKDLKLAAQEFCDKNINILAINGGDGTISRTISAFIQVYQDRPLPLIALLPGGTANTLAKNLRITKGPEKNLYKLIEAHCHQRKMKIRTLNTLKINDQFGFLFANGVCSNFLKEFYKNKTNIIGALFLVFKTLISFTFKGKLFNRVMSRDPFKLVSLGELDLEHESCTILCSTIKSLPLGIPFFDQVENHENKFQCISIVATAGAFIGRVLPKVLFRRIKKNDPDRVTTCIKDLEITGKEPFTYTIDGELFESDGYSVRMSLGPKLKFITL